VAAPRPLPTVVEAGKGHIQAELLGEQAGRAGKPARECPHGYEDGRRRQRWMVGWKRGAAAASSRGQARKEE
jgi:ribosome modulation factor